MLQLLNNLFSTKQFIPHGHCYLWKPELIWLHITSDFLITLAYYSIPFMLIYFIRKRRDVPFDWIFLMFGTFIVACGTTHLLDIWTLWHPNYWLSGLVKAITALASLCTAGLLVLLIPQALTLPSPAQLETTNQALRNEITQRQQAEDALKQANEQLEVRVRERTTEFAKINESLEAEIAQRKRAEEVLRRRQQEFQALVENAPDIITRLDRNLRHVYVNPAVEQATGLLSEAFIGKSNRELGMPEELVSAWESVLNKVFEIGQEEIFQFQFPTPKGLKFYQSRIVPELAPDGSVESILGISRDISDVCNELRLRKRVENALRQSKKQFRAIFNQAAVGIAKVGLDGQWLLVNQKLCDIVGYTRKELLERTFQDITHPDDLDTDLEYVRRLLADEIQTYSMEKRYICKNASYIWINLTVSLVRDSPGEPQYFIAVVQDISDAYRQATLRKRAEEELRQGEERLRLVLQNMPVMMDAFDQSGNIIIWNRECERVTGYTAQEIVGNPRAMELIYPNPDYRQQMMAAWAERGNDYRDWEWELTCKDGSVKIVSWSNLSQQFPIPGWASWGVGVDISDRKRAEQEIRELNSHLERRVAERTAELKATNQELEAFSYSVSHDLRAPLRGIDGFSKALLDRYADQLDDKGKHYLERIRTGTQRMGELIDDLLKLSRVTRSEMKRTTVDLSAMAQEIATELSHTQPERHVEWAIAPGLVAQGDARLLRIVLENLLNNAWKFTSSGIHPHIEFSATLQADAKVTYRVRDNGAGFDMAYANKLFGAFQRLHSTTQFPGTGIGLATVQRIIHRHGGRVWAEGAVEQGATFYFTL